MPGDFELPRSPKFLNPLWWFLLGVAAAVLLVTFMKSTGRW